jgi:RecB family exonuclease
VITPRETRLVRVGSPQAFREAAIALAVQGSPLEARDRLVIVPTRAAAEQLVRGIERSSAVALAEADALRLAVILPDFATSSEIVRRLADRLPIPRRELSAEEREVLLRVACRAVMADGIEPPFLVRPGLVAEMVRFYDDLRRNQKDVDTFERLALGILEPGAADDRGARQLVDQTRFLAAVFRNFERRCAEHGADEHELRQLILAEAAPRAYRHVVVTATDRTIDRYGLTSVDWDLLARTPGITQLDVVVTDRVLVGALHERIHTLLPGIQEVRFEPQRPVTEPVVSVPDLTSRVYLARDREEEVATFARRVKTAFRNGRLTSLERAALVVQQPLPYVYLARAVLGSAGLPCQLFDALPLAAEPYAAALDLVLAFVSSGFARVPGIHLLRSPHFRFTDSDDGHASALDLAALDRALTESGYAGEHGALERLLDAWTAGGRSRAVRGGRVFQRIVRALAPLRSPAAVSEHLVVLQSFLAEYESRPAATDPLLARYLRARGAVMTTVASLRDAHRRFDESPVEFDEVAALLRRWIEGQTFAPRAGDSGVHVLDSASAPFGDFEHLQCAGLVDGEWPDRPRRNIFYGSAILRELGWPGERGRADGARAAFADLLSSPSREVAVSAFLLEHDAVVSLSPLVDEIEQRAERVTQPVPPVLMFDYEALTRGTLEAVAGESAREWSTFRTQAGRRDEPRFRGETGPHHPDGYSLSGLERYQDCPFKFFSSDVLRLDEPPEDGAVLSARARGRFVHELLQQFFAAWDAREEGGITPARLDAARTLFAIVAEPLLARLPQSDAALERARLFGSALSVGIVDTILAMETARPGAVRERWLEYRLEGDFTLGGDPSTRPSGSLGTGPSTVPEAGGRRVPLRGVADRIDLLEGNRLRIVDYKTGSAPERTRALQVPIYALCAQERLASRDGHEWTVDEAVYVSFAGRKAIVEVAKDDDPTLLSTARERVFELIEQINAGVFPPRPHDPIMCGYCAYSSVCRKDYVE